MFVKENFLLTYNYSFSQNVWKSRLCVPLSQQNTELAALQDLTLSHIIPTFNDPRVRQLSKTLWKKETKCWLQHFILDYQQQTFKLSSANALNLDQSKILSFGKELIIFSTFFS